MAASTIAAFWAVSFLFVITPGADWAYAITAGLRHRTVLPAVGGLLAGHLLATAAVAAGVAALVAGSPTVMAGLTAAGAAYLVWLGAGMLAQPAARIQSPLPVTVPSAPPVAALAVQAPVAMPPAPPVAMPPAPPVAMPSAPPVAMPSAPPVAEAPMPPVAVSAVPLIGARSGLSVGEPAVPTVAASFVPLVGVPSAPPVAVPPVAVPVVAHADGEQAPQSWVRQMGKGLGISGLNPKVFLLFLALLPQFTRPAAGWPVSVQIIVLGLVHVTSCAVIYTAVGVGARRVLRARPSAARAVTRVSGAVMVMIGALLLVEQLIN